MHMADALISPAVGGTMWAISGGLLAYCANKIKRSFRDNLVPLMGVLGAFIFAAQMINFSIPGTGSSGHLGGGLILTALLGPHAAFLVVASVLTVQAFFFADGGLLALGCNIFNLGFFPAFVAYPLIYTAIVKRQYGSPRAWAGAIVAAVAGLQLGAFSVVLETQASGISALPFGTFVLVVAFVARARPDALPTAASAHGASVRLRPVLVGLGIAAAAVGGVASWFASTHPDGLEWSMARVGGKEELEAPAVGIHHSLARVQERTALLPDYGFKATEAAPETAAPAEYTSAPEPEPWPAVNAGTSLSGIVGGLLTLALACLAGLALRACSIQAACRNG